MSQMNFSALPFWKCAKEAGLSLLGDIVNKYLVYKVPIITVIMFHNNTMLITKAFKTLLDIKVS